MRGISLMTSFMLFFVCVILSVIILLAGSKLIFMPILSSAAEFHPKYLGQQIVTYVSQASSFPGDFQAKLLIPITSKITVYSKGNIMMVGYNGYVNFTVPKDCDFYPEAIISNFSIGFPTTINLTLRIYDENGNLKCEKNESFKDVNQWYHAYFCLKDCQWGSQFCSYKIKKGWSIVIGTGNLSGNSSQKTENNTPFKLDYITGGCWIDENNIASMGNANSFIYDPSADGNRHMYLLIESSDIFKTKESFNFTFDYNFSLMPITIQTGSKTKYLYITKGKLYGYDIIKFEYK
ncbi:MAG: hypothetical protein KQA40_01045 [Candidatus Aenigmarchaeota archaeon]|nr:hypothetical protein [Candidatus Aenigmarchaeota archaeon]